MEAITGKVISIQDDETIVINKGSQDGVSMSCRFLIYNLGEELFDPDTNESLGVLEIVCGVGKPAHIQEKMTTLVTSKTITKKPKKVIKTNDRYSGLFGTSTVEEEYDPEVITVPFEGVKEGSMVKQIEK